VIALFTDFGNGGPYVGQMHAAIRTILPAAAIVDLFHDVPTFNVRAGAYLLPAYAAAFPLGTIFCCVVDPGVGHGRARGHDAKGRHNNDTGRDSAVRASLRRGRPRDVVVVRECECPDRDRGAGRKCRGAVRAAAG